MEKRSDISRDSFRPEQGFTSVRLQQGRPQLDADWNEQVELQLRREHTTLFDILGPAISAAQDPLGSPATYSGFRVDMDMGPLGPTRVSIHGGRIYVDGQLIQAEGTFDFTRQPFCPNVKLPSFGPPSTSPPASLWVVYLDTFEREVTALDDSVLREAALGIPDTTTRTQQAWQVRFLEIPAAHPLHGPLTKGLLPLVSREQPTFLTQQTLSELPALSSLAAGEFTPHSDDLALRPQLPGQLQARFIDQGATLENRLYRVEITDVSDSAVGIRWSRDNGAVVAPLLRLAFPAGGGQSVVLARPAVGDASVFAKGQWLEITTPGAELRGDPPQYRRIRSQGVFEAGELTVPIEGSIALDSFPQDDGGVRVRLWNSASDQSTYPLRVPLKDTDEGPRASDFFPLEDGIEVQLVLPLQIDDSRGVIPFRFAPGQYWQIPMRAVLGGIDWPLNTPRPAQELRHSYLVLGAALALSPNPNRPQERSWRQVGLLPAILTSLPQLDRRLQQASQDLASLRNVDLANLRNVDLANLRTELVQLQPKIYEIIQDFFTARNLTISERCEVRLHLNNPAPAGYKSYLTVVSLTCTALAGNAIDVTGNQISAVNPIINIDNNGDLVITAIMPINFGILRINLVAAAIFARVSNRNEISTSMRVYVPRGGTL